MVDDGGLTASVVVQGQYRADAPHGEFFQPVAEELHRHTCQNLTATLAIKGDSIARESERSHINGFLADEGISHKKGVRENPCEWVERVRFICHVPLPFMPSSACTYMPNAQVASAG